MTGTIEDRRARAVGEFERQRRIGGARIVDQLDRGLTLTRDLFYVRLHLDVERQLGKDSMLIPLSEAKAEEHTYREIDIYQVVESSLMVGERGYVSADAGWYMECLGQLRLGVEYASPEMARRIGEYRSLDANERRLRLSDAVLETLPESQKAPLILFRLFPLAVRIATATAFDDTATAAAGRAAQVDSLPVIRGCSVCRGVVLPSGQHCAICGNPLWRYEWLTVAE